MDKSPSLPRALHYRMRRMAGHDPDEQHRTATPLEGLLDLTFATCFGLAAAQFALVLSGGQYAAALIGFSFASFAICWAWINFSWFSSAYDTDDWIFRLVTMMQMIGVLVLAMGLPRMFASVQRGEHPDNSIMVFGYVIMRIAMVSQWLRAARQNPSRRRACLAYALIISVAQIGWVIQLLVTASVAVTVPLICVLATIELVGPVIAERKDGGTPWHAHHITERYSLFALIALGEGVVGTVAALSAVVEAQGWSLDAALVCTAGVGLTFGLWWIYYLLPSAPVLHAHRERAFIWGYGQMMVVGSIVATGAGLRVAAYSIAHQSHIRALAAILCTAIPVGLFLGLIYSLHFYLVRRFDRLHRWLLLATAAVLGIAVMAAIVGIDTAICLMILMLAPAVTVVGYEVWGHHYQAHALSNVDAN